MVTLAELRASALRSRRNYESLPEVVHFPPMPTCKPPREEDPVNKPEHYQYSSIQPIDVIDAWGLDFYLGSVIKYLSRYQRKGKPLEDLEKALWFLSRKVEEMKKNGP